MDEPSTKQTADQANWANCHLAIPQPVQRGDGWSGDLIATAVFQGPVCVASPFGEIVLQGAAGAVLTVKPSNCAMDPFGLGYVRGDGGQRTVEKTRSDKQQTGHNWGLFVRLNPFSKGLSPEGGLEAGAQHQFDRMRTETLAYEAQIFRVACYGRQPDGQVKYQVQALPDEAGIPPGIDVFKDDIFDGRLGLVEGEGTDDVCIEADLEVILSPCAIDWGRCDFMDGRSETAVRQRVSGLKHSVASILLGKDENIRQSIATVTPRFKKHEQDL